MDPLETLASTAEPAFASNSKSRIVAWNAGAERLLGHVAHDVLGKPCFEVLDGKDVYGNRFCDQHCPIWSMVRRHEPIRRFRLSVCTASSERIETAVSVVLLSAQPSCTAVHLLEAVRNPRDGSGPVRRAGADSSRDATAGPADCVELTTRETDVLRVLCTGATTPDMAQHLSISEATVRNHVRNILAKLGVHSRLEAVCLAVRRRMI